MSREVLLALMRDRLGLDVSTLGERVIDDACADARRALGVADDAALVGRVLADADAFAECAECFVVPESWFFRAADQFADLLGALEAQVVSAVEVVGATRAQIGAPNARVADDLDG